MKVLHLGTLIQTSKKGHMISAFVYQNTRGSAFLYESL